MEGRHEEAIDLCNSALEKKLAPSQLSAALMTRGNAYAGKGDWDHALRDYDESIKAEPTNADALTNRGNAHAHKHEIDKSTRDYDEAIRLNPKLHQAYYNRAANYLLAKDTDHGLADLNEAIRLNPGFVEPFLRRSGVFLQLKRTNEALADAEAVVTLTPESIDAYILRARVHLARKEFAEARADFERALQRTRDSNAGALNSIAWFFATCPDQAGRDGKKAVDLATKACQVRQWKDARVLDTLAAAFAEAGDFDQATKWQMQALGFSDLPIDSRAGMQKRLALYQRRQPYRQDL
jgi:tetratricopeptide (TPR) repeat protein